MALMATSSGSSSNCAGRLHSRVPLVVTTRRRQRASHRPHRGCTPHRGGALEGRQLSTEVHDGRRSSVVLSATQQGRCENRHPRCSHHDQNDRSHLPRPPPNPLSVFNDSMSQFSRSTTSDCRPMRVRLSLIRHPTTFTLTNPDTVISLHARFPRPSDRRYVTLPQHFPGRDTSTASTPTNCDAGHMYFQASALREKSPERPPDFSHRASSPITISRSIALHMS